MFSFLLSFGYGENEIVGCNLGYLISLLREAEEAENLVATHVSESLIQS